MVRARGSKMCPGRGLEGPCTRLLDTSLDALPPPPSCRRSTCDCVCSRVLAPTIKQLLKQAPPEGEAAARAVLGWCRSDNLWLLRSSVVGVVTLARHPDSAVFPGFRSCLLEALDAVVRCPERFAQVSTGSRMDRPPPATLCALRHCACCGLPPRRRHPPDPPACRRPPAGCCARWARGTRPPCWR